MSDPVITINGVSYTEDQLPVVMPEEPIGGHRIEVHEPYLSRWFGVSDAQRTRCEPR